MMDMNQRACTADNTERDTRELSPLKGEDDAKNMRALERDRCRSEIFAGKIDNLIVAYKIKQQQKPARQEFRKSVEKMSSASGSRVKSHLYFPFTAKRTEARSPLSVT
uniref:Uncharacterized protein n=1 Tax=Romanomermis culicivorax TaxID=13658 RepID=A0A915JKI6_ROMCU